MILKKMYKFPQPHLKDLIEETLYSTYLAFELRMDFYIDILKVMTIPGESV